ncbi:hypothetical protein D3C75_359790 [compost metagenome]
MVREGIIFLKIALDPALFTVNLLHITPFADMDIPSGQERIIFLQLRLAASVVDDLTAPFPNKLLNRLKACRTALLSIVERQRR